MKISRKSATVTGLLALTFLTNESWRIVKDNMGYVNPWFALNYPIPVQWFVKELTNTIEILIAAIVINILCTNRYELKLMARGFLTYRLMDFAMFFICFNEEKWYSSIIYPSIPIVMFILWRTNSGGMDIGKGWKKIAKYPHTFFRRRRLKITHFQMDKIYH